MERCDLRGKVYVMLLTAVAVAAAACGAPDSSPGSVAGNRPAVCLRPTCEEVPVKRGNVTVSVSADGTVQFVNKVDLFFRAPGRVSSVDVGVGDTVQEGQVLATLGLSSLELGVAEATVSLQAAEEALQELLEPVTQEEFQAAELAVSVAQDVLQSAEDEFGLAQAGATEQELAQAVADVSASQLALQEAETALEQLLAAPTTAELAGPIESVAQGRSAILAAELELADLMSQVGPTEVAEAASVLALAAANLEDTEATLATLEAGPDPLSVSELQRELELAQIQVLRADLVIADLEDSILVSQEQEDLADAELDRAVLDVDEASAALELLLSGPTDMELSRAQLDIVAAEVAVAKAEEALDLAETEASGEELSVAQASVDAIKLGLEASQQALEELNASPDPLKIRELEDQIALAQANLKNAEGSLTKLRSGPDVELVGGKLTARSLALEALIEVEATLVELRGGPDPAQVELHRKEAAAAQAGLVEAKDQLNNSTIEAPFDGIVSAVNVEYGQDVEAEYGPLQEFEVALIELLDTSVLEIVALVDEDDIGRVRVHQRVDITVNALPDMRVTGVVESVSTVAVAGAPTNDTSYEVTISAEPEQATNLNLLEGMTTAAEFVIDKRSDVLYVPVGALRGTDQSAWVEVVDGQTVTGVDVVPGLKNTRLVEVKEGVEEGQIVRVYRSATAAPIGQ